MECLIEYRNQNVTTDILGIEYKSVHKNKRDLMFNESDKIDIFINMLYHRLIINLKEVYVLN